MVECLKAAREYAELGFRVVGASSTREPFYGEDHYRSLHDVPYIYEPDFVATMGRVIEEEQVDFVYCPHSYAYTSMERCIKENGASVRFINLSLRDSQKLSQQHYMDVVAHYQAPGLSEQLGAFQVGGFKPSDADQAAVIRYWDHIEGHCPIEKALALFAIAPAIPSGDIVEIGCLSGKSAYILLSLSKLYGLGELLCIDPWNVDEAIQHDLVDGVKDIAHTLDFNAIHTAFCQNLKPFALDGGINYLRLPSKEARALYKADLVVETPEFGRSSYSGKIACIHIDGNHDYRAVVSDIRDYGGLLTSGGWMIVDDYLWALGSGPKQAADEYIKDMQESIELTFVAGEALFIKRK